MITNAYFLLIVIMVELPLLELCGPVSSFRASFIRRTAAVLTLKVAVDFEGY